MLTSLSSYVSYINRPVLFWACIRSQVVLSHHRQTHSVHSACCFQNGYPARRRSLVDDARFETLMVKQTKQCVLEEARQRSNGTSPTLLLLLQLCKLNSTICLTALRFLKRNKRRGPKIAISFHTQVRCYLRF
jgi:hypothetical protein